MEVVKGKTEAQIEEEEQKTQDKLDNKVWNDLIKRMREKGALIEEEEDDTTRKEEARELQPVLG